MKKLLKILVFVFLFLALAKGYSLAYYTTPDEQVEKWEDSVYNNDQFNLPSHGSESMDNLINKANELIAGPQKEEYRDKYGGGAMNTMNILMASLYGNPPASSLEYFADLGKNLGIAPKTAYAQGTGFGGLRSLLPLWKQFRNVAYSFFVIFFIGIGLAIMFRLKIDPKTVISIQNALPRIIIALILVTFSYAIAGLLIDLMYVVSAVGVSIIAPPPNIASAVKGFGLGGGGDEAPNFLVFILLFSSYGLNNIAIISDIFNPITLLAHVLNAPSWIVGALRTLTFGFTGIASGLVTLILLVVLLFTYFKLFFMLLSSYISIILSIIVGPIQIMLQAFPGQNGFTTWLKNLIANLAVFPTVIIILALISKITNISRGGIWSPPIIGGGGIPSDIIVALIGFGMFLFLPKAAAMVKEALSIKPFKYGTAIGEAFGPVGKGWKFAAPAGRQLGAEQFLGTGIGSGPGWQPGLRGTAGRVGQAIGLWREPK